MNDYSYNFSIAGQAYQVELKQDKKTELYLVSGQQAALDALKLEPMHSLSIADLHKRFTECQATNVVCEKRVNEVAREILAPNRPVTQLDRQPTPMGRVIIIGGHSTAGKTTIINAIMRLDPNQKELGIDLTPPRSIYEYLETNHTKFGVSDEDWQHLHDVLVPRDENYHIHDAIDGEFQFRDEASEDDKSRAKMIAEKLRDPCKKYIEALPHSSLLVLNKAYEVAGSGKNVVMDTVNIDKLANHPIENQGPITKVLVYCKLSALSSRLTERTREALESGHPENVRAGTFPLHQYLEVFGPRKAGDSDQDIIDTVSRETVEKVIDEQFDAGIEDLKRRNPELYSQKIQDGSIAKEKEDENAKLVEAFGFSQLDPMNKTVQLTPRLHWTMRVDTSDFPSVEDIAKQIIYIEAKALADKIQKCNGSQHAVSKILSKDKSLKENIPLLMEVVTLVAQRGEPIKACYAYFFTQKLMTEIERPASLLHFSKVLLEHAKEAHDMRSLDLAEFHLEMVRDSKEAEERDEGERLLDDITSYAKEILATGTEQEKMAAQDILDRITIYSLLYLPASEEMREKGITRLADVPCSTQELELLKKADKNIETAFEVAVAYQNRVDARPVAPPGKLYEIPVADGTISLHAKITGTRKGNEPIVILEAGCGCISNDWNYVQESLGPDGPLTISYDRAGLGWSEPGKEKPTAERAVAHLEALLKTLKLSDGPFVYVGHSYGGVLAQLFALKHPKQMAGLVLVDSATDASKVGPFTRDFVMEQLPPAINNGKFWQAYDEKTALGANQVVCKTKHFDAMILETDAVGPSIQLLRGTLAQTKSPPYDVPLKVIGAGIYDTSDSDFAASQEPLIERSSTSAKYILAQNSTHMVMHHEPEIITRQIRTFFPNRGL